MNNAKMRQAFSRALNRQAIVEHVTQGNQTPATGIVPPLLGWKKESYYRIMTFPKPGDCSKRR